MARGYLTALVTGKVSADKVQAALQVASSTLPHYKQVRGFHIIEEPFTIESGLLTANGKLKRDLIAQRFTERNRSHVWRGDHGMSEHGERRA